MMWEEVKAEAGLRPRPTLFRNFILHFVKILTSRSISFSIFSPPHIRGLAYIILPSTPQCPHNVFLLSLEK